MNMVILAWTLLRNTLVWCVVLRSVQLHLYYTHRRNFGGGGQMPLQCFLYLRTVFLATELKRGKWKIWGKIGGKRCMYTKGWLKPIFPLLSWLRNLEFLIITHGQSPLPMPLAKLRLRLWWNGHKQYVHSFNSEYCWIADTNSDYRKINCYSAVWWNFSELGSLAGLFTIRKDVPCNSCLRLFVNTWCGSNWLIQDPYFMSELSVVTSRRYTPPCVFLVDLVCTIYRQWPVTCHKIGAVHSYFEHRDAGKRYWRKKRKYSQTNRVKRGGWQCVSVCVCVCVYCQACRQL